MVHRGGGTCSTLFRRSWELTKASLAVLRADRELLVFLFVSFIALVIVTFSFAVPWILVGGLNEVENRGIGAISIVVGFLFYLVSYTVVFFFNTALVGAAMIRLDGGDPTLGDGFRIARSRLPQIVGYALVAATVGMILRWISDRAGLVGQIVTGIIGFAWVLVVEKVGPIEAIKRSGSRLRKTWGEQLIGNAGIGIVFGLLSFAAIALGVLLVMALVKVSTGLAIIATIFVVLIVGILALIGAAASGIFTASLYRYATKGDAGPAFRAETMSAAFRTKGGLASRFGQPR